MYYNYVFFVKFRFVAGRESGLFNLCCGSLVCVARVISDSDGDSADIVTVTAP